MDYKDNLQNYQTMNPTLNRPRLGKKTELKKKILPNQNQNVTVKNKAEIYFSFGPKEEIISSVQTAQFNQIDNLSTFLLKTMLKVYYLSRWKRQVKAMKYYSRNYNPKRINFKKLLSQISSTIKQHKYEYANEIFEKMKNMPMPKGVNHDVNYGKLKIINKEVLMKKNTNKIIMWSENNYKKKRKR